MRVSKSGWETVRAARARGVELVLLHDDFELETLVWCVHCERSFAFGDALVDPSDGLVECAVLSCDGSMLDLHVPEPLPF